MNVSLLRSTSTSFAPSRDALPHRGGERLLAGDVHLAGQAEGDGRPVALDENLELLTLRVLLKHGTTFEPNFRQSTRCPTRATASRCRCDS